MPTPSAQKREGGRRPPPHTAFPRLRESVTRFEFDRRPGSEGVQDRDEKFRVDHHALRRLVLVLFHEMKKRMKFRIHWCLGSHRGEEVSD
jgi:hypothetical protein